MDISLNSRERLALVLLALGFGTTAYFLVYGYNVVLGYLKMFNMGLVSAIVYSLLEDEDAVPTDIF